MRSIFIIAKSNTLKRPASSLIQALIVVLLVSILLLISSFIAQKERGVEELLDSAVVTATVYDQRGQTAENVWLIHKLDAVENMQGTYIKDLRLKRTLEIKERGDLLNAVAMTMPEVEATGFQISYLDGYDEQLFESEDSVCIVPATHPEREQMVLTFRAENSDASKEIEWTFQVVGTYAPMEGEAIELLFPWKTGKKIMKAKGDAPQADACGFTIMDNRQLDDFKHMVDATRMFTPVDTSSASAPMGGTALVINDGELIVGLRVLRRGILILRAFHVALLATALILGVILSAVSLRGQKTELSISRCLGAGKGRVVLSAMIAHCAIYLMGLALSLTIMGAALGDSLALPWRDLLYLSVLYALGVLLSSIRFAANDVIKLIQQRE